MVLSIDNELQARLMLKAGLKGASPEAYALEILNRSLSDNGDWEPVSVSHASADQVLETFANLGETATPVRNYPPDFFSRDVIYADHD